MKKLLSLSFIVILGNAVFAQDTEQFQKYLGEYSVENAPFSTILIDIRDGSFWGEAVGEGDSELLTSDEENVFDLESVPDAKLIFTLDDNSIVTGLELRMADGMVTGVRQFPSIDDFVGQYTFEPGGPVSELTVTNEEGSVVVETAEFGKGTLENTSRIDVFLEPNYQSDFIFMRNQDGVVSGLKIDIPSQGMTLMAEKEMEEEIIEVEEEVEDVLNVYVGDYEFPDMGFTITVENRDGRIYAGSDQGEGFMDPTDVEHQFKAEGMDVQIDFKMNENGKVSEMILTYQGQPMSGVPVD